MTTDWFGQVIRAEQLKRRSVQGVLVSVFGAIADKFVYTAGLAILARILTPADFGVLAIAAAIVGLMQGIQGMGLAAATIRYRDISHAQVNTLFWLNQILSVSGVVLIFAIAGLAGAFYNNPELSAVLKVLACGGLVTGLVSQHRALLRRHLRFSALARILVISTLVNVAVSLGLAWHQPSVWSLVAGTLAGQILSSSLVWRACDWRPSAPARATGVSQMIGFGLRLSAFSVFGDLARNAHGLVLGRHWGAQAAGHYARAWGIHSLINRILMEGAGLVVPSGLAQLDADKFCNYYYKAAVLVVMAVLPFIYLGYFHADAVIGVLLGPQWGLSISVLHYLALSLLPQALMRTSGWVYLSKGDPQAMLQWGLIGWGGWILAVLVAAPYGVIPVAVAMSVVNYLLLWPCMRMAFRGTGLRVSVLFQSMLVPVSAGLAATLVSRCVVAWFNPQTSVGLAVFGTVAFASIYAAALFAHRGTRNLIQDVYAQIFRQPST